MSEIVVEYRQQLVRGTLVRSLPFMRRVRVETVVGYRLVWVPSWRVLRREAT